MKSGIPSEHYYKLLEWKDENMNEFHKRFSDRRMCDLTTAELEALYEEVFVIGIEKGIEPPETLGVIGYSTPNRLPFVIVGMGNPPEKTISEIVQEKNKMIIQNTMLHMGEYGIPKSGKELRRERRKKKRS